MSRDVSRRAVPAILRAEVYALLLQRQAALVRINQIFDECRVALGRSTRHYQRGRIWKERGE